MFKGKMSEVYNIEGDITTCTLTIEKDVYVGVAKCDESDYDFKSTLIGQRLAFVRAVNKFIRHRRNIAKSEYKLIADLFKSISQGKAFNKMDYTSRKLYRAMKEKETEVAEWTEILEEYSDRGEKFIDDKIKYWDKIRKNRKAIHIKD